MSTIIDWNALSEEELTAAIMDRAQKMDLERTVVFNTGRQYTEKGQRIAATVLASGQVAFCDYDRGIQGTTIDTLDLELFWSVREFVLTAYDYGRYQGGYHRAGIDDPFEFGITLARIAREQAVPAVVKSDEEIQAEMTARHNKERDDETEAWIQAVDNCDDQGRPLAGPGTVFVVTVIYEGLIDMVRVWATLALAAEHIVAMGKALAGDMADLIEFDDPIEDGLAYIRDYHSEYQIKIHELPIEQVMKGATK